MNKEPLLKRSDQRESMKSLVLWFCLALSISWQNLAIAIELTVVTEDEHPIQYLENGKLTGPAYRFVNALLAETSHTAEIQVLPWSRAYKLALSQPNVLIFSIVRTPQREDKFFWVGQIHPLQYHLIKLKKRTDLKVEKINTLGNYRVGTIRDSATEIFLKSKGLAYNLVATTSAEFHYDLLMNERVEFITRNIDTLKFDCFKLKLDCDLFESAFALSEIQRGFYVALNLTSDKSLKDEMSAAFQKLKDNGTLEQIMGETYSQKALDRFKSKAKL